MAVHNTREEGIQSDRDQQSLRGLFSELGDEVSHLLRGEIALARAETSEKLSSMSSGATMLAIGGAVSLAALVVLMMAAVYAFGTVMHLGWAALIVGGIGAIIGLIAMKSGSSQLKARNLTPQRTQESLRRDAEMVEHEAKAATRRKQQ